MPFFRLSLLLCLVSAMPALAQTCNYRLYDAFDYTSGEALNGQQSGTGWLLPWEVQNANNSVPGYAIHTGTPLSWLDLQSAGNYAGGGYAYLTAGRRLNTQTGGPFAPWLTGANTIGTGTMPLWASVLLRKTENNDENVAVTWHSNNIAWCAGCTPVNHIAVGYFGAPSNINGEKRWSLSINGIVYPTAIPMVVNQTAFFVLKMEFGTTNTITLYVNPATIGAALPATPSLVETTTAPFNLRSLALYLGNDAGSGFVDELRMGDSYACVAPDAGTLVNQPPTAQFLMTPSMGNAPLTVAFDGSGSTDPNGSIVSWQWNFGDGSPEATGEMVNHTFTATGVLSVQLTVTDNEGVSHTLSQNITVYNQWGAFTCQTRLNMLALATCGNNNGSFQVSNISGVNLDLRNAANNPTPPVVGNAGLFNNLSPGNYTLYVSGASGCRDTFQLAVAVDSATCQGWQPEPCAMKIGVGLEGISYYIITRMFKDYFKTCGTWITYDPTNATPGWNTGDQQWIPADANGYATEIPFSTPNGPRALRGIISANGYIPMGEPLRLLYEGTGAISMQGNVTVTSSAPGQIDFTINDAGNIWFHITSSVQGDPIRNIRVIAVADQGTYLTAPFRDNFLEKAGTFSCLRYMDLMRTNGNNNTSWAGRTLPGYYSQAESPNGGMAYEYIIQLANQLDKDVWICVPHAADDDYITQMATLFKTNLNPGIQVYLEYSNEVWNWIFAQAHWVNDNGPQNISYPRRYVERAQNVFRIWRQVWGAEKNRVKRVLGTQNGYDWVTEEILAHADQDDYDYISPSWYVGLDHSSSGTPNLQALGNAATAEDVLENATHVFHNFYPHWRMVYNTAKLFKKKVVNYEGGQHFTDFSVPSYLQAMYDAQVHPGMYDLYQEMLDSLRSLKSELPMAFVMCGPWQSIYGSWGHIFSVDDLGPYNDRPKYQVLLDNIDPCTTSLATELTHFEANCLPTGIEIKWTVNHENRIKTYWIESSSDGILWRKSAAINPNNSGQITQHYRFETGLETGPYFRLATENTDGQTQQGAWRFTDCHSIDPVVLSPNPASLTAWLQLPAEWSTQNMRFRLTSIYGQVLQEKQAAHPISIDLGEYPPGIYCVSLQNATGETVYQHKLAVFNR